VADLPIDLEPGLADRLAGALDIEGKIPRALDELGPVGDRDVLLVDRPEPGSRPGLRDRQLIDAGARVVVVGWEPETRASIPGGSADAIVAFWSEFRGDVPGQLADADRVGRPGGRLLVVHDYGRDDVARLVGERPEHGTWSQREGPFLSQGFKVRVVHCWWTFGSMDEMCSFLAAAFGARGTALGQRLSRPRISHNVAIYHRTMTERPA
jgi:hypothetical protein